MDCRQIAEHLVGGREGLTSRAGREEFASEKKASLSREWLRRVLRLGTTIGGGDGNGGDGYGEGGGGSANRRTRALRPSVWPVFLSGTPKGLYGPFYDPRGDALSYNVPRICMQSKCKIHGDCFPIYFVHLQI